MASKTVELLAPAGSRKALEAAIEGGADAVYLGASAFNARMRAENFDADDMRRALSLARAYGVKTYVTLNTRLFDDELTAALRMAAELYSQGADALIVADMGLAALIKKHMPDFEMHASTQLSGHSVRDAEVLKAEGFSRMVCHREIDKDSLKYLCRHSPIEIEMFVHGACCVSFSGQCLMSAVLGGRSGNRGECAQPCRQPYFCGGKKGYPISLKDMCLASYIPEICESGVASLKIEGRQKPPEYVFGVTRIYRRLLDEKRRADEGEVEELKRIFSRGGFTDGYYTANGRDMRGVRTMDDYRAMDKTEFPGLSGKVPLDVTVRAADSEKGRFTAHSPFREGVAETEEPLHGGDVPPLTPEGARGGAARLGETPYYLNSFEFSADSAAPLTLSMLNRLRRSALEAMDETGRKSVQVPDVRYFGAKPTVRGAVMYTAEFQEASQIPDSAADFFSRIYLPYGSKGQQDFDVSLPPYMPDGAADAVLSAVRGRRVLCHSAAQMFASRGLAAEAAGSLRLNIFNSAAAHYYGSGAGFITAAPEVRLAKLRHFASPCPLAAVVYGRLPLMLTVRCAISDGGEKCSRGCGLSLPGKTKKDGTVCRGEISDRHRVSFPVLGMPDCTNVIYNSVPIYMADRLEQLRRIGVSVMHFIFTDETADECRRVIEAYKSQAAPEGGAKIRRLQI